VRSRLPSSNILIPDLSQERPYMHFLPQSPIRATVLTIAVLVASAGVAVMMFVSPTYEASVRIRVEKEIDPGSFVDRNHLPVDPYWVQEQFQALRSKAVLLRVITNLGLTQRCSNLSLDDADVRLPGNLIVRPFPSTSLVEIGYWSKDPQESANVANAIATTYRDHRLEQKRAKQAAGITILEKQLRDQDAKIAEREHQPDAESLKQVRERLVTRLQEAKAAPLTSSVQILEVASPPPRPIRDPRKLGLSLIGLGAILAAFELLTRTPGRNRGTLQKTAP
jgi:uncharacterized protein involved in exopolysaccharide biosynthesis